MTQLTNDYSQTIWDVVGAKLPQQASTPMRLIARALGVKTQEAQILLKQPTTAEALLKLHTLAQYRYLAIANRVWPILPWLDWNHKEPLPLVFQLITGSFGRLLLTYVEERFGREVVLDYWTHLEPPPEYDDIEIDPHATDPFADVPETQWAANPYIPEEEKGELFIFGTEATPNYFRSLIRNRQNYATYVDNWTGYVNDPMGTQLADDLRRALKDNYWAALPPDTLPAYLALARALQSTTVPEDFLNGPLPELSIVHAAVLYSDVLEVVLADWSTLTWHEKNCLKFDKPRINVFVLDADGDTSPAALILTMEDEPGNPEKYLKSQRFHYLVHCQDALTLALVPRRLTQEEVDLDNLIDILEDTLGNCSYALHKDSQTFCVNFVIPFFVEGVNVPVKA